MELPSRWFCHNFQHLVTLNEYIYMTICSMTQKSDMFIFHGKCEAHRPGSPPSIPFQGCWHSATCCSPATCYNGVAVQTWQAPTLTTGWETKRSAQFKRHIKTNMPTCVAKSLGPFKARVSSSFSSVQLRPWGLQFWDTLQLRGDNNWEICYVLEFGNILALILQWTTPLKSHEIFIVSLIYIYICIYICFIWMVVAAKLVALIASQSQRVLSI